MSEILSNHFKNKTKGVPEIFGAPRDSFKLLQGTRRILSDYFKNKTKEVVESLSNYFKNQILESPEILSNPFKHQMQGILEILSNCSKSKHNGLRDSFKPLQKPNKRDPGDSLRFSKFFGTNSGLPKDSFRLLQK